MLPTALQPHQIPSKPRHHVQSGCNVIWLVYRSVTSGQEAGPFRGQPGSHGRSRLLLHAQIKRWRQLQHLPRPI